ncbi:hypothetical protein SNOG_02913 [Parastagonospora nodorum SN15]|uniref:Threonylcarbamoyl-AMP synthase n=1 Tax=Phaeosphaeria nodorum (strain SN15 / ATCC MYA-4574 / FGSC 10173) TaxID=321614 RepID=Q0UZA1_PHANO|nr:hypothetical protein SNOG_02913 [Parastagonospora nodorum SN15]EAT89644.2 hypothetical protein SNOG_02913 [Parastagonospora nodorum SN15]
MDTQILAVDPQNLGNITFKEAKNDFLDEWEIDYGGGQGYESLKKAADELVKTDVPVAFPTETVYGLGADATRSSAVKSIFAAKGRPADNPLIVHIHSLSQLRALLSGQLEEATGGTETGSDSIPTIYKPLIERFWPGPLTIILPTPTSSILAPEVTAGLPTFGARWENVTIGYKDKQEGDTSKPRAPGMKYRHYSPKAQVVLFEAGAGRPSEQEVSEKKTIGLIRTKSWKPALGLGDSNTSRTNGHANVVTQSTNTSLAPNGPTSRMSNLLRSVIQHQIPHAQHYKMQSGDIEIWDIDLGAETEGVARGLFSALRELDKKSVEVIYVEGIDDKIDDDIAAAVMNRLRKAAEIRV